jgi:hypothetical protein
MLSAKQGNNKYHLLESFGMTRPGIEPTTFRTPGRRSNHSSFELLVVIRFQRYVKRLTCHNFNEWSLSGQAINDWSSFEFLVVIRFQRYVKRLSCHNFNEWSLSGQAINDWSSFEFLVVIHFQRYNTRLL